MKTLQQEYQLIKEGKGNKDHFLKVARHLFPEYITTSNDFKSAVHILKSKSLLSEAVGGVVTLNNNKPDWFKIFDKNIREAVGVKDKEEYGDQNKFTADKDVEKILKAANFDNADPKNIDNLYGQSFLLGFLTEMWDEKNADKTANELKAIVAKNMAKDINYYHTEASFGVKGIGYTKDVVGGGEPVAPKGKYKSSGYGDMPKTVKEGLINEAKKSKVGSHLKEIEKTSAIAALESKIQAAAEAIETRKSKLEISESEDLVDMMDKSKINSLKKEIKQLEKYKMQCEKKLSKMGGKKAVVDNEPLEEEPMNEFAVE